MRRLRKTLLGAGVPGLARRIRTIQEALERHPGLVRK